MHRTYAFIGNEHFVDLIRDAFARVLEERGYHLEVSGQGPGGPHVYEYRRDDHVVAVQVDERVGEKWEAEIAVECDQAHADQLTEIVSAAITGLLADLSRRLLESVLDEESRSRVARELRDVLATLE